MEGGRLRHGRGGRRGRKGAWRWHLLAAVAAVVVAVAAAQGDGDPPTPPVGPPTPPVGPPTPPANATLAPTTSPTGSPVKDVKRTLAPTGSPLASPSAAPSKAPTTKPSLSPSKAPTNRPSAAPSKTPTTRPTKSPTETPSRAPTRAPIPRAEACKTERVGVILNDCQPTQVQLGEKGSVDLSFGSYDWYLPFVLRKERPTDPEVIEGRWKLVGKGYGANDEPIEVPGPTLHMAKGARVSVRFSNDLLVPNGNTGTHYANIHTHGLHVSPEEDDPAISVLPGQMHNYEYTLPTDHAGGTHWYHPHAHPLSELYVGSGAAGLLLVDDAEDGTEIYEGLQDLIEIQLVLQHVQPAVLLDLSDGKENEFFRPDPRVAIEDQTFQLDFSEQGLTVEQGLTRMHHEFYLVNGFWHGYVEMQRGVWHRLRMLNISPQRDVMLRLYERAENSPADCQVKLLARDGVYMPTGTRDLEFEKGHYIHLTPANRADLLVRCSGDPGAVADMFDEFDAYLEEDHVVIGENQNDPDKRTPKRALYFSLRVTGREANPPGGDLPTQFQMQPCLPYYMSDLLGATAKRFGGLTSLQRQDVVSKQVVRGDWLDAFNPQDGTGNWADNFETYVVEVDPAALQGAPFPGWIEASDTADESKKNITIMLLGEVQQWEASGYSSFHPLHIHVNHFQLVEDIDDGTNFNRAGDWIDVVRPRYRQPVAFRFRTDTFTGKVAVHCHNMEHNDMGAMGQAFIIDNPAITDSRVRSLRRPWSCTEPIQLTTPAPTMSPTKAPSKAPTPAPTPPTKSPTATPTGTPTKRPTASPTQSPTITDVKVDISPREMQVFPHEGLTIDSDLIRSSPGLDVQYCWTRDSRDSLFAPSVAARLGIIDLEPCDFDDDHVDALSAAYDTSRRSPKLVIKPWVLQGGTNYTFKLHVRQEFSQESNQDSAFVRVQTLPVPPSGRVQVDPVGGTAGTTRFNITLVEDGRSLDPGRKFRFAIQRNTLEGETVALASDTTSNSLDGVLLPFTKSGTQVAFVTIVAFVVGSNGAVSRAAAPFNVRLTPPAVQEVTQRGFVASNDEPEESLRSQMAVASIVSLLEPSISPTDVSSREGFDSAKVQLFAELDRTFARISSPEFAFSTQVGQLAMYTLRNAAFSLDSGDDSERANLESVARNLDALAKQWVAWLNEEALLQLRDRRFINFGFAIPRGVINIGFEGLSRLATMPYVCEAGDTLLLSAYASLRELALWGLVSDQSDIALAGQSLGGVFGKRYANRVAGRYKASAGASNYVELPDELFNPGQRSTYEEIGVSLLELPATVECAGVRLEQPAPGNGTRRALQLAASPPSGPFEVVVSNVLRLGFAHNGDYSTASSLPAVNVSLETQLLDLPEGNTVKDVRCAIYDDALGTWSSDTCTLLSAPAESPATAEVIKCSCTGVSQDNEAALAAVAYVEPMVEVPPGGPSPRVPIYWQFALTVVGATFGLWALASLWAHKQDREDASRTQKGATLLFLASKHFGKTTPSSPKPYKRSAFEMMRQVASRGYVGTNTVVRASLLSRIERAHSLVGLFFFNARIPRLHRSTIPPLTLLCAFSLTHLTVHMLGLDLVIALPVSGVGVGLSAFGLGAVLNAYSLLMKKNFHRVAHLQSKSVELCRLDGSAPAPAPKKPRRSSAATAMTSGPPGADHVVSQRFSPEEDELRARQLDVYRHAQHLKHLQADHDRMLPLSARLYISLRSWFWFLSTKPEKVHLSRIYGGKENVFYLYRRAKLMLDKMERDYNIRRSMISAPPLITAVIFLTYTTAVVLGIFLGSNAMRDPVDWFIETGIAYAAGIIVVEPILLALRFLCCAPRDQPSAILTKPRGRFYSWDSRVSTRSEDQRNAANAAADAAGADAALGLADDADLEKGKGRSGSIGSHGTERSGKTHKSAVSSLFNRYNLYNQAAKRPGGFYDEDDFLEYSDGEESAFESRADSIARDPRLSQTHTAGGESRISRAASRQRRATLESRTQAGTSVFSARSVLKSRLRGTRKSKPKPDYVSDEDDNPSVRPDDCDYV